MKRVTINGRMTATNRFILEAWLLARGAAYRNNDRGGIDAVLTNEDITELRNGGHSVYVWK